MCLLLQQKNKLVGTILNIYHPTENHLQHPHQHQSNSIAQIGSTAGRAQPNNEFNPHYMEFVDSPPDSKEAWPNDYLKSKLICPYH